VAVAAMAEAAKTEAAAPHAVANQIIPVGSSGANRVAQIAMKQQKKSTDVVEPQVIDEQLLREGVDEPTWIPTDDEPHFQPIRFPEVTSLRLSFLNIIEISNLNNFDQLTTLRLDNNIIETMENLWHLKTLTWLDLSFNNISKIEGLEELVNLTDLSLYNNHIEHISGLSNCKKLNILSLGRNSIQELKELEQLREFPRLRCVCLDGNPVCKKDTYKMHVLAYLPDLKYLDYMLIDKKQLQTAADTYQVDDLAELREKETLAAALEKEKQDKLARLAKARESFLDCTEDMFDELFGPEIEPPHVKLLPSYSALKDEYKEKLHDFIKQLKTALEEKNTLRLRRVASFERAVKATEHEAEDDAKALVKKFGSRVKKAFAEKKANPHIRPEGLVQELADQLERLRLHLMTGETQVQEALEEAMRNFESSVNDIIKFMQEKVNEFIHEVEVYEKNFGQQLTEGMTSEITEDGPGFAQDDESKPQLGRDEMFSQAMNFTEARSNIIAQKEEHMTGQMNGWVNKYFDDHRQRQYERNRQRVMEIKEIIDQSTERIQQLEERDEDDVDDGGAD